MNENNSQQLIRRKRERERKYFTCRSWLHVAQSHEQNKISYEDGFLTPPVLRESPHLLQIYYKFTLYATHVAALSEDRNFSHLLSLSLALSLSLSFLCFRYATSLMYSFKRPSAAKKETARAWRMHATRHKIHHLQRKSMSEESRREEEEEERVNFRVAESHWLLCSGARCLMIILRPQGTFGHSNSLAAWHFFTFFSLSLSLDPRWNVNCVQLAFLSPHSLQFTLCHVLYFSVCPSSSPSPSLFLSHCAPLFLLCKSLIRGTGTCSPFNLSCS